MRQRPMLIVCFVVAGALPLAVVAQDLPQTFEARGVSGLVVDEDAPQPTSPVFEAPRAEPDPFGPMAPAIAPAEPPRAAGPAIVTPADGEVAVVDAFRVHMTDSSQLVGQLQLAAPLVVKTKYGEVKLSTEDIARVDCAMDDGQWRFTLAGGDRVTGAAKLTGLTLKTSWGEVTLDEKKIASLEGGKLHTQQYAMARTSPDGRTRSMVYRTRQVFAPVTEIHHDMPYGYPSASPYAPASVLPAPAFSAPTTVPTTLLPSPR